MPLISNIEYSFYGRRKTFTYTRDSRHRHLTPSTLRKARLNDVNRTPSKGYLNMFPPSKPCEKKVHRKRKNGSKISTLAHQHLYTKIDTPRTGVLITGRHSSRVLSFQRPTQLRIKPVGAVRRRYCRLISTPSSYPSSLVCIRPTRGDATVERKRYFKILRIIKVELERGWSREGGRNFFRRSTGVRRRQFACSDVVKL